MKITICIGSSCHLKGSRPIIEQLSEFLSDNNLKDSVELAGVFCMGRCKTGVCVQIGEQSFSLTPDTTKDFFEKEVLPRARQERRAEYP